MRFAVLILMLVAGGSSLIYGADSPSAGYRSGVGVINITADYSARLAGEGL